MSCYQCKNLSRVGVHDGAWVRSRRDRYIVPVRLEYRYEPSGLSYGTVSRCPKPAYCVRIGYQDVFAGGIQMIVQPIKYAIRNVLLLGREQAIIAQVPNSMEYSDRLTGPIVHLDCKSQEH